MTNMEFTQPGFIGPRIGSRNPFILGDRFDSGVARHVNGAKIATGRNGSEKNKFARRILRKRGMMGPLGRAIAYFRQVHENVAKLASNSHEARRYILADRLERMEKVHQERLEFAKSRAGMKNMSRAEKRAERNACVALNAALYSMGASGGM